MSVNNFLNMLASDVENLEKALSQVPLIQWGEASGSGWVYVPFSKVYSGIPSVLAIQTPRPPSSGTQIVSPPQIGSFKITAPTITPPSLAPLQVTPPSPPVSWGQKAKSVIAQYCSSTIGQVPVIGGYMCQGIDNTFGLLAYYVGNAIQSLYYAFDMQALINAIAQAVEYKTAQDWNSGIQNLQNALDQLANDINGTIKGITDDANNSINAVASFLQSFINNIYSFVNQAYGLAEDLSIPVAQVSNVSSTGFSVYIPEGSTVYWIAVG